MFAAGSRSCGEIVHKFVTFALRPKPIGRVMGKGRSKYDCHGPDRLSRIQTCIEHLQRQYSGSSVGMKFMNGHYRSH